jgi:hypothetical protein
MNPFNDDAVDIHCDHTIDWGCPVCDPEQRKPTGGFKTPILPDWTRWSWASVAERQYWQPMFAQASQDFIYAEKYSVVAGLRDACWLPVKPEELVGQVDWARRHGIMLVPTHQIKECSGYGSTAQQCEAGTPSVFRCLYIRPERYKETAQLSDDVLADLLGYPKCCQQHYADTWAKGQVDSTFEQFSHTTIVGQCNTLLRWMGIRLVSHMPCSYDCAESEKMADTFLKFGATQLGPSVKESFLLINDALHWPVKWSRKFGIAEIVTPALKISARTDWTPTLDKFEKPGTYTKPDATFWTDNQFIDHAPMRESHAVILNSLLDELPQGARVLDLGCGNAALLRRLTIHRPDVKIAGVDSNKAAISRIPSLIGKWWTGSIEGGQWADWNPTAILINPLRLIEMSLPSACWTREQLAKCPQVFVYTYSDLQDQELADLTAKAGLPTPRMLQKTPTVSIGVVANV